jgi:hypothetical protein
VLPYDKEKRCYFGNPRNVLGAQAFVQKHENFTERPERRKKEISEAEIEKERTGKELAFWDKRG